MADNSTSPLATALGLLVAAGAILALAAFASSSGGAQPAAAGSKGTTKPNTAAKPRPKSGASSSSSSSSTRPSTAAGSDDDDDEEDAAILKGYKKTSDGRKTTYFNRELSAEDKKLLESTNSGPKPITVAASTSTSSSVPAASSGGTSAWNSAQTFEERNLTSEAHRRLKALLLGVRCDLPGGAGVVRVTGVCDIAGDCVSASSRGKKRIIYDLSCTVKWELSSLGSCVDGTLALADITADPASLEAEARSSSSSPKVAQFVKSETQGLRPAVTAQLQTLLAELSSLG